MYLHHTFAIFKAELKDAVLLITHLSALTHSLNLFNFLFSIKSHYLLIILLGVEWE